jgi:PAS domain S-box-containing protein
MIKNLNIFTRQMSLYGILSIFGIGLIIFVVIQFNTINKTLNNHVPNSVSNMSKASELNEIALFIRYYDEVLTQSTRNYALTGNTDWLNRYNKNVPLLDEMVKRAIRVSDGEDKALFASIDTVNQNLVAMEANSQTQATKGNLSGAISILDSPEYTSAKEIYEKALVTYVEKHGTSYDSVMSSSTKDVTDAIDYTNSVIYRASIITRVIILFIIIFMIVAGRYILLSITNPLKILTEATERIVKGDINQKVDIRAKDEIGTLAQQFNAMTEAIKKSRLSMDRELLEKTKSLDEKEKFMGDQRKAILNVLEDVESEKDKVSSEKDKTDTILQSIGDAVFVVDTEQKIILVNSVTEKISGLSPEQLIGKTYTDVLKFVFEDTKKINNKFMLDALKTGITQEMSNHTVIINNSGDEIPISDSAAPLKDKDGKVIGCVVVFRDVTKERQIDKAKTEFVSLASHQLRTPLSAINWYVEMLLAGDAGKLSAEQKNYVNEVYNGNKRMVDLVNSLLNVSRIGMGTFAVEPENVNICNICEDVIKELTPQIVAKKLSIIKEHEDKKLTIFADPKLMRIVMQNFLTNAVKYTPEKGIITASVFKIKAGSYPNVNSDSMLMKISDTGYGIPESQKEHIFEKLFRADNVREKDTEGTGLGLYIVKSIIEQSGGVVWFESKINKGTSFYATIPLKGMVKKEGNKELT